MSFHVSRRAFTAGAAAFAALPTSLFAGAASAQTSDLDLIGTRILGVPDAPIHLIEYSSMTCPHCAAFHVETLPLIKTNYIDTGKVKLEMRDYPLNEAAALGSLLSRCAPEDRYFPLVDLLFAQQNAWARSNNMIGELARLGAFAGMSQEQLEACFQNNDLYAAIVRQRDVWNEEHEVRSTPTFYINDAPLVGNQPYEQFVERFESILS
jgi:protein-disulfide isomerase